MPIQFSHPWFLFLLFFLPFIWYISIKGHPPLSSFRRKTSLALRLGIFSLLIFSLAGIKISFPTRDQTVFFLMDASESITSTNKELGFQYIEESLRMMKKGDQAGIILFGRDAFLESLPQPQLVFSYPYTRVNPHYTNIAQALKLAVTNFPPRGNKKIVLLTDGNENRGEARNLLDCLKKEEISVSVFPLTSPRYQEVLLKDLILPPQVKIGEEFKVKVIAQSYQDSSGLLKLYRNNELLGEKRISLRGQQNIFLFPQVLEQGGFYTYKAILDAWPDRISANNQITGYTVVEGSPRILLLTKEEVPEFVQLLKESGFQLEIRSIFDAPSSREELKNYHVLVLNNVPTFQFSQHQLKIMASYVRDLGGGLLAIGGKDSFGLGGYYATFLEEALPVYTGVQQKLIFPTLSMVLVIDKSGSMAQGGRDGSSSTKISLAKKAALAVVNLLANYERIGVISFDTDPRWTVPLQSVANKSGIARQLSSLEASGGTDLFPALEETLGQLKKENSLAKHVVILSDGLSREGDFEEIIKRMTGEKITVSTVAIGQDADVQLMRKIAQWGKGKAYYTDNIQSIPRIFTTEALRVSRSLTVKESFIPILNRKTPLFSDIDWENVPPLEGYVITTPKQISDVQLSSPRGDPILSSWRYGLGRAVVFTSDLGGEWSKNWQGWPDQVSFWTQIINWILPQSRSPLFPLAMVKEGQGRVIVDAIDEEGKFINFLSLQAKAVKPEDKEEIINLDQTLPGRYEGSFSAEEIGPYMISIFERGGKETISPQITGTIVPYSPEYRQLTLDDSLLTALTAGTGGKFLTPLDNIFEKSRITFLDPQTLWPFLLLLTSFLLLGDIGIRVVSAEVWRLAMKEMILAVKVFRQFLSSPGVSLEKYKKLIEESQKKEVEPSFKPPRSAAEESEAYYKLLAYLAQRRKQDKDKKED